MQNQIIRDAQGNALRGRLTPRPVQVARETSPAVFVPDDDTTPYDEDGAIDWAAVRDRYAAQTTAQEHADSVRRFSATIVGSGETTDDLSDDDDDPTDSDLYDILRDEAWEREEAEVSAVRDDLSAAGLL